MMEFPGLDASIVTDDYSDGAQRVGNRALPCIVRAQIVYFNRRSDIFWGLFESQCDSENDAREKEGEHRHDK